MRTPGETVLLAALLLSLAPTALAQQESDPSVNESDFDASQPPYDEQYLDEEDGTSSSSEDPSDPTLGESDFDMSTPQDDTSYLDDAEAEYADGTSGGSGSGDSPTPGPGLALALGAVALGALAMRRR